MNIRDAADYSDEVLAEAYGLLFTDWGQSLPISDKADEMRRIIRGSSKPCRDFADFQNCLRFLESQQPNEAGIVAKKDWKQEIIEERLEQEREKWIEGRAYTYNELLILVRQMLEDEGIKYHYVHEWMRDRAKEVLDEWYEKTIPHQIKIGQTPHEGHRRLWCLVRNQIDAQLALHNELHPDAPLSWENILHDFQYRNKGK